jgi:hypothetical protein
LNQSLVLVRIVAVHCMLKRVVINVVISFVGIASVVKK